LPTFSIVFVTHVTSPAGIGFRSSSIVNRTPSCSTTAALERSAGIDGSGVAAAGTGVNTGGGSVTADARADGGGEPARGG
jgi:hypothetical protein